MKGVIQEYFSGSSTTTHNLKHKSRSISLANDGQADLTITINDLVITIKSGEYFEDEFELFTTITVTTTSAYRLLVRA
jgi:hypothetical protein